MAPLSALMYLLVGLVQLKQTSLQGIRNQPWRRKHHLLSDSVKESEGNIP
jgi:hypothetical protein